LPAPAPGRGRDGGPRRLRRDRGCGRVRALRTGRVMRARCCGGVAGSPGDSVSRTAFPYLTPGGPEALTPVFCSLADAVGEFEIGGKELFLLRHEASCLAIPGRSAAAGNSPTIPTAIWTPTWASPLHGSRGANGFPTAHDATIEADLLQGSVADRRLRPP